MQKTLKLLESFEPVDHLEAEDLAKVRDLLKKYPQAFERDHLPGHITGSALVVNKSLTHVLLNHHKKLNMWIQFGGHSDGDPDVKGTALREAMEESGLKSLQFHSHVSGIFDVSVHRIPAHDDMPAHEHHDIRFLLVADMDESVTVTSESHDIRWVDIEEISAYNTERSFRRMLEKIRKLRKSTKKPRP